MSAADVARDVHQRGQDENASGAYDDEQRRRREPSGLDSGVDQSKLVEHHDGQREDATDPNRQTGNSNHEIADAKRQHQDEVGERRPGAAVLEHRENARPEA